ncbi:S9 family peptidase [Actinocrispum sp. NPDC049592]|uniref:S9 family peptidase n=1 Tax=Actinocrispum sp. NPDC049592 TaxID=3154835 RepID=UPI0034471245
MRPEDIELLTTASSVTLRGELLLVAAARPVLETNDYQGAIHRVALDGSGTRPWTHGRCDTEPVISPDGTQVAFLRSAQPKAKPQLYVQPVDGGDARKVTSLPLGAQSPVWSPDSRRIAFLARIPEEGRYTGTDAQAEAPRRILRLDYHVDDIGYLADRRKRLFVVDTHADAEPVELTDGTCEVGSPAWSGDGSHIVFTAPRGWHPPAETLAQDIFAVPAGGGEPILVCETKGDAGMLASRGGLLAYLGREFSTPVEAIALNTALWVVPFTLDGPAEPRRLTDLETLCLEDNQPAFVGDDLCFTIRNRGAIELRRLPVSASLATLAETTLVAGERGKVAAFAVDGDRVVAVVSTPDSPGEVVVCGGPVLTSFGTALRDKGICEIREIVGTSPDGYESHGWVVLPAGEGPHPVVLHVHGGPFMYHGWGFFDEAQVYASAGYAVVLPNPRGSSGYGQAHGRAILGAFGTVDVDDVLSVLDAALALPGLDSTRVGVMGGSYGGFMTSWLAAHHGERFKAAWSERAVNAWDSFSGSSDIGWFFTDAYIGADPEAQAKMSPLTHADLIRIPFLIAHSEQDWRCPIEQAQRMFVALRRQGTPVEMLIFPGEGHELTRSGQPRHRRQRFDAVLEWWQRHLA